MGDSESHPGKQTVRTPTVGGPPQLVFHSQKPWWVIYQPDVSLCGMDWAFRIREEVPSWAMKLVLIMSILIISGLQYFNII
jgi:hypothetical protein